MRTRYIQFLPLMLFGACCWSSLAAQQISIPPKPSPITAQKPDPKNFRAWDDYEEALINWAIDQKVTLAGKQVILNTEPPPGRYQIVFNPGVRADTFLLDTETGKTWVQTEITDVPERPTIWMPRDRVDNPLELSDWLKNHSSPPTQAPK